MRHLIKTKKAVLTALVLTITQSNISLAQDSRLALEEVVVTAQKREQNLQDVPIAVKAVLGDEMRASGIEKLETLAPTIPGLHVSEAIGSDQIFLRGLGPGVNLGFEQTVGQLVDGFFFGRSRFSRLQFLDLERVEVLKGPQGAIIGKNTTAGAINITTARPTDELEAWITLGHEFDGAEGQAYEGAISGPITDTLKARLALRYEDKDGFFENTVTGDEQQSRDDVTGRFSLQFEPTDTFSALFQFGFSDIERAGRNTQIQSCTPQFQGFLAAAGVAEDCTLNDTTSSTAIRNGESAAGQDTEASTFGLTLEWELENVTLTSLTGYAEYEYLDVNTASATAAAPIFNPFGPRPPPFITIPTGFVNVQNDLTEDYEQFSQEFRIASNGGGAIDYTVGFFYQQHDLSSSFNLQDEGIFGALTGLAVPPVPGGIGVNRRIETNQDGDTYAAFGQVTWHVNDQWDLTLEGRYTKEEKDGRSQQFPAALFTTTPIASATPAPLLAINPLFGGPLGLLDRHDLSDERSETNFSPGGVIQWRPTDGHLYYASVKKGFKGGGFDHQSSGTQATVSDGRFTFEDEEVLAFEIGGKLSLADGAARLNVSIFRNEFDNLQVSALTGPGTFTVGNAASATTQGIEVDGQWRATEALTFTGSLALLDAEYDSFEGAACNRVQINGRICPPMGGTQDLSGETLQYSPDYSYNVTAEYVWPLISDKVELVGFVQVYGEDDKQLAQDLDPNTVQSSFTKVDARISVAAPDGQWNVSLIGRNLGDKTTLGFANDVVVSPGSYFGIVEAPRTVILQGTFRY